MRRRSNWPLLVILAAAAVLQAGLGALTRSEAPATNGGEKQPGVLCTACGPIATGVSAAARSRAEAPFLTELPSVVD